MIIKSKDSQAYEESFIKQIPAEFRDVKMGGRDNLLALWAVLYYPNYRSDLSVELIRDILQRAGVISDDRWIRQEAVRAFLDKENPRAIIRLYEII